MISDLPKPQEDTPKHSYKENNQWVKCNQALKETKPCT